MTEPTAKGDTPERAELIEEMIKAFAAVAGVEPNPGGRRLAKWQPLIDGMSAALAVVEASAPDTVERDRLREEVERLTEYLFAREGFDDVTADKIIRWLAKLLNAPDTWSPCDGTETWDGDVHGTLMRVLQAAGVIDEDTGVISTKADLDRLREEVQELRRNYAAALMDGNDLRADLDRLRAVNAGLVGAAKKFLVAQDGEGEDDILDMLNYGDAVEALRSAIAAAEEMKS